MTGFPAQKVEAGIKHVGNISLHLTEIFNWTEFGCNRAKPPNISSQNKHCFKFYTVLSCCLYLFMGINEAQDLCVKKM